MDYSRDDVPTDKDNEDAADEDNVEDDEATEEWCATEHDEPKDECEESGEEEAETLDEEDTLSDEMRERWPPCDRCGKEDCRTFPVQEKWLCMDCKYLPPDGTEPEPESQNALTQPEPDEEPESDHDEGDDEPMSKKARYD